jgi:hypothetical protein
VTIKFRYSFQIGNNTKQKWRMPDLPFGNNVIPFEAPLYYDVKFWVGKKLIKTWESDAVTTAQVDFFIRDYFLDKERKIKLERL